MISIRTVMVTAVGWIGSIAVDCATARANHWECERVSAESTLGATASTSLYRESVVASE